MNSGAFVNAIESMENWGLTDVLLPFLLIFTIMFAILQKTKILGLDKKNFSVIIALVIALTVVIPHVTGSYPPDGDIVDIMNSALPNISIVVVAIVMLLILIGILGGQATWMGGSLSGWIAIVALLIVLFIFGRAASWYTSWPRWLWWLEDPDTQALVIIILIFGIIIWWVTKEPSEEGKKWKLFSDIGDFFKGNNKD